MKNPIECLQKRITAETDALWISDEEDRFYFTNFRSSQGVLLVTSRNAWFFCDGRYYEEAASCITRCKVVESFDLYRQTKEVLKTEGMERLLICAGKCSLASVREIQSAFNDLMIEDSGRLDNLIENLRMIKDDHEADFHREAQRITDDTFNYICGIIRPGITELAIAQEIGCRLTKEGSESNHYHFIVASGKNSALPHGFATRKTVQVGDIITMDFGAVVQGRLADMTRTVALGRVTDEQRAVYNIVLEAQQRALDMIRPGVCCRDVDAAARAYIYNQGYRGCFSHGLGHAVGVQVHENPRFNESCTTMLASGHVMTVEPGIYLKGRFGVRIEDMLWVTSNGYENFTRSPKNLMVL